MRSPFKPARSPASFDWAQFRSKLPTGKDKASEAVRKKLWDTMDVNQNNFISLAEFDRGLREVLGSDKLQVVYKAKPPIIRAFNAARAMDQTKGRNAVTRDGLNVDDFVSWSEFRLLLAYLRLYFELWIMFTIVDGGARGDRGIGLKEFKVAVPHIETWGRRENLKIDDPGAAFNAIDQDGSGVIRFDEL